LQGGLCHTAGQPACIVEAVGVWWYAPFPLLLGKGYEEKQFDGFRSGRGKAMMIEAGFCK